MKSPEEHQRRSAEARGILDHPLFVEALQSVDAHLKQARERASVTDTATHTRLVLMEQCQAQLVAYLKHVMMTGDMAKAQLLREQRALERMQSAFRRGLRL